MMKIVLSRKGFDSTAGGVPSPIIMPEGRLLSLPIPEPEPDRSQITYGQLRIGDVPLEPIVGDLTRHFRRPQKRIGHISAQDRAHLDPDLDPAMYDRQPGWRPLFGQVGAAQGHLDRCGIAVGDLFLFFGWFREAARDDSTGHYEYLSDARDLHVIFGWLQIGDIITGARPDDPRAPDWARYHPHFQGEWTDNNTVYIASRRLRIPGLRVPIPGGGTFKRIHPDLILTHPDSRTRSLWRLPAWCRPRDGEWPLTYHSNPVRWDDKRTDCTVLQSVGKGQEFVLDAERYPEALSWTSGLMAHAVGVPHPGIAL